MSLEDLGVLDLSIAAMLVLVMAGCTVVQQLGLARDILVATLRMAIQLFLIGLVLRVLFDNGNLVWVVVMALVMLLVAGREITVRQKRRLAGIWSYGVGTSSLFVSSFAVAIFALAGIIQADPWYAPQYAIPILGMLLGNTMTGIALSLDRLTQAVWQQRKIIEQRLLLGEDRMQALIDIKRDCLRSGMMPLINSMAVAGIVSLPGMMTGQILAGSPPVKAVQYQILIWMLIAAGAGFGMMLAIKITAARLFDERDRLRLDRLKQRKS